MTRFEGILSVVNHEPLTLEVPTEARYLPTVRLFVGAAGQQFGMSEDRVEDLKLATSDTCAWLMRWKSEQDSPWNVVIRVSLNGDGLQVMVESDRGGPAKTKPQVPVENDDEVHLGLDLIEALTGEIQITEEESATTVTFSFSL